MGTNITWSVMKDILQKTNLIKQYSPLMKYNRYKYTKEIIENPSQIPHQIDYQEVKNYRQFLSELRTGPNVAITTLMKILSISREDATTFVKDWKDFSTLTTVTIMHNEDLSREAGIDRSMLREHPFVLANTTENLSKKIVAVQSIGLEIDSVIPLFQLPVTTLMKFASITKNDREFLTNHTNRISYLSDKLKTDIYKLCVELCHYPFILDMPIIRLLKITEYLIDIGFSVENIIENFVVYRYSMNRIKNRLDWGIRIKIHPLTPRIINYPADLLQKLEMKETIRKNILKSAKTLAEYISGELNCDIESAEALIKRDHTIESINIENLSKILKFLHEYGYTIQDIYRSPKSLHSQKESMKKKYDMLRKYGVDKPSLFLLVSSENMLTARLNSIKNELQKNDKNL